MIIKQAPELNSETFDNIFLYFEIDVLLQIWKMRAFDSDIFWQNVRNAINSISLLHFLRGCNEQNVNLNDLCHALSKYDFLNTSVVNRIMDGIGKERKSKVADEDEDEESERLSHTDDALVQILNKHCPNTVHVALYEPVLEYVTNECIAMLTDRELEDENPSAFVNLTFERLINLTSPLRDILSKEIFEDIFFKVKETAYLFITKTFCDTIDSCVKIETIEKVDEFIDLINKLIDLHGVAREKTYSTLFNCEEVHKLI